MCHDGCLCVCVGGRWKYGEDCMCWECKGPVVLPSCLWWMYVTPATQGPEVYVRVGTVRGSYLRDSPLPTLSSPVRFPTCIPLDAPTDEPKMERIQRDRGFRGLWLVPPTGSKARRASCRNQIVCTADAGRQRKAIGPTLLETNNYCGRLVWF